LSNKYRSIGRVAATSETNNKNTITTTSSGGGGGGGGGGGASSNSKSGVKKTMSSDSGSNRRRKSMSSSDDGGGHIVRTLTAQQRRNTLSVSNDGVGGHLRTIIKSAERRKSTDHSRGNKLIMTSQSSGDHYSSNRRMSMPVSQNGAPVLNVRRGNSRDRKKNGGSTTATLLKRVFASDGTVLPKTPAPGKQRNTAAIASKTHNAKVLAQQRQRSNSRGRQATNSNSAKTPNPRRRRASIAGSAASLEQRHRSCSRSRSRSRSRSIRALLPPPPPLKDLASRTSWNTPKSKQKVSLDEFEMDASMPSLAALSLHTANSKRLSTETVDTNSSVDISLSKLPTVAAKGANNKAFINLWSDNAPSHAFMKIAPFSASQELDEASTICNSDGEKVEEKQRQQKQEEGDDVFSADSFEPATVTTSATTATMSSFRSNYHMGDLSKSDVSRRSEMSRQSDESRNSRGSGGSSSRRRKMKDASSGRKMDGSHVMADTSRMDSRQRALASKSQSPGRANAKPRMSARDLISNSARRHSSRAVRSKSREPPERRMSRRRASLAANTSRSLSRERGFSPAAVRRQKSSNALQRPFTDSHAEATRNRGSRDETDLGATSNQLHAGVEAEKDLRSLQKTRQPGSQKSLDTSAGATSINSSGRPSLQSIRRPGRRNANDSTSAASKASSAGSRKGRRPSKTNMLDQRPSGATTSTTWTLSDIGVGAADASGSEVTPLSVTSSSADDKALPITPCRQKQSIRRSRSTGSEDGSVLKSMSQMSQKQQSLRRSSSIGSEDGNTFESVRQVSQKNMGSQSARHGRNNRRQDSQKSVASTASNTEPFVLHQEEQQGPIEVFANFGSFPEPAEVDPFGSQRLGRSFDLFEAPASDDEKNSFSAVKKPSLSDQLNLSKFPKPQPSKTSDSLGSSFHMADDFGDFGEASFGSLKCDLDGSTSFQVLSVDKSRNKSLLAALPSEWDDE